MEPAIEMGMISVWKSLRKCSARVDFCSNDLGLINAYLRDAA